MRKLVLALVATATVAIPLVATATPASATERHCYTPHVGGFDTYEVCYYLPVEPTQ